MITIRNTNPSEIHIPMCRNLFGRSSGIEHIAIWQNPPPNPVMAKPAVNCEAPDEVAVMMKPTQQHRFPNSKKSRRPKRSEFAPAIKKPIALPVVYAGTYQYEEVGSPKAADSLPCRAAVVGTGQNERPNVEERTWIVRMRIPEQFQETMSYEDNRPGFPGYDNRFVFTVRRCSRDLLNCLNVPLLVREGTWSILIQGGLGSHVRI
jgi:hypothetical protein